MEILQLFPEDLQAYLHSHAIPGTILHLEVPTPTVESAAQAVGSDPEHIVKSILFLVAGNPLLAIASGPAYIDRRVIARISEVSRKQVKLAGAEEVLQITGYPVGGMPPFGHKTPLPTLIDRRVLEQEAVYAGGGDEHSLLRIAPPAILEVTQAQVSDLIALDTPVDPPQEP